MNKVMFGENRKRGGRNTLCRLLRSGRWFLCLALLCSAMLPGFASAASGDLCENLDGGVNINLKLPPSVTLEPGQNKFPEIPPVTVRYRCVAPEKGDTQIKATIVYLSDGASFLRALDKLGLTLTITVTDNGINSNWTYVPYQKYDENILVGTPYTGNKGTGDRTMTIKMSLSRNSSQNKPGFYALPALSSFILRPYYNSGNGPLLVTPALRIQYVPKCFVKTSVSPSVDFGPVMKTDVNSSLSVTRTFKVRADADFSCSSGMDVLKDPVNVTASGGTTNYYLDLPLKVSFIPQGDSASDISDHETSLLLRNDKKQRNGLKLQIYKGENLASLGEIDTVGKYPPPGNMLGDFTGINNTWSVPGTYKAVLTYAGGQVLTGSYNAQVLVKVEYY
ncbi:hypothetical protein AAAM04_001425 [Salmonella enterica]